MFVEPPVHGEAIRALCADGDGVWAGTYGSTLLRCDAEGVKVVAPPGSFPGTITSMVRAAAGSLWIGTSRGLHLWENGRRRTWTPREGLPVAYIRSLHLDRDGTLWLGTLGGGLVRFKEGKFTQFTTAVGLGDDVIAQILADDHGNLWLGSNRGVMRIPRRDLEAVAAGETAEVNPLVLGKDEGLVDEQCFGGTSPNACKSRDGRLFFPTMGGIAEVDPTRLDQFTRSETVPRIEQVLVNRRHRDPGEEVVLPPGQHRLEIAYSAPVLRGGEWVRFRHKLEGRDRNWSESGSVRHAIYEGLPPGHYSFRVAAVDGSHRWREADAALYFTVQPNFWQRLWFRGATVLVLVGLSGVGAWWHFHRKHQRRVAQMERERKQQSDMAHASRVALLGELSASIVHELKQPLTAIMGNAQAALQFLKHHHADPEEMREILREIADEDRRASEIIDRMRSMLKKGESKMELRDINADVHLVLLLIRGDLVARGVTVETELCPGLPLINGDHIQLQQVLLNLVMNGCDAMQANAPDERRLVIRTVREDAGHIGVSICDVGHGISSEMRNRIFEPFFSTKETGLGMGLAICRAIIGAHGGRLTSVNNPDRGATFQFTLLAGRENAGTDVRA